MYNKMELIADFFNSKTVAYTEFTFNSVYIKKLTQCSDIMKLNKLREYEINYKNHETFKEKKYLKHDQ